MDEFDLRELGEIVQAIEELDPMLRLELAAGPLDDPECRICRVLKIDDERTRGGVAGEAVYDFHTVSDGLRIAALTNVLGTSERPTVGRIAVVRPIADRLRRTQETGEGSHLAVGFEALADQLTFMRCLFVYMVAGWRP